MAKTPTMHWSLSYPRHMRVRPKAFCGRGKNTTTDQTKISCLKCRNLMKLHGHLVEEEPDLTRLPEWA